MAASQSPAIVQVRARASFASPGWSCERGDIIEVPLADAFRMIARGLAVEVDPENPKLPKPTREEAEAARVVEVATINTGTAEEPRYQHFENTAKVRPLVRK
jgi:hypothetical protein